MFPPAGRSLTRLDRSACPAERRAGILAGMWRRFALCALIGAILAPDSHALNPRRHPNSYSISSWSVDRGLPSDKVRDITQTRDGYLWIATAHGIVRFDGYRFVSYTGATNPELRGGGFFDVMEDADGTLWAGGDNGLFRWNRGKFDRFTVADGLAHDYVRALSTMRDGTIVICTREGYSLLRDGQITTPGGIWRRTRGVARSFLERSDGTIYLGTDDGLWRIRNERIEQLSGRNGLPPRGYVAMLETDDGSLWIGHATGIRRLLPDDTSEDYGAEQGLGEARVSSLLQDRDGNLWVAGNAGLYRLRDGRAVAAPYAEAGLSGATLQKLFEDREGAIWVAAAPGLFRIQENVATSIGVSDGLTQASVYSVLEASDGAWWIGVWNGGVYRFRDGHAERWSVANPRPEQVLALAETPHGTFWIGAISGLYRTNGVDSVNFYRPDKQAEWQELLARNREAILPGLVDSRVNAISPDGAGGVWVATDDGLYRSAGDGFRLYNTADGLPGNVLKAVRRAATGDVWVTAPPVGVGRLRDGKWITYRCGTELSTGAPRGIYEDSRGHIWVYTEGGGVNRFDGQTWRVLTTEQGLVDDYIASVVEDAVGNMWLAFPRGIMRIARDELDRMDAGQEVTFRPRVIGRSDGLPAGEANQQGSPSSVRTRDGRLLFATDRGVAIVEPDQLADDVLEPPVFIERVLVDGKEMEVRDGLSLPPGTDTVEIQYTAVETLAPEKIHFRIKLAPLDGGWVDNGTRRDVRYAKLPPGEYQFSVVSTNPAGYWGMNWRTLAFTIRPHFYQTAWFVVASVGSVVSLLGLAFWTRARLERRRRDELEQVVEERTRALRDATHAAEAAVESKNEFIAALKEAQAETARQQARFKFVFDVVPIGFSSMIQGQPETRIVNPAYTEVTGVPAERSREERVYREATHPDDRALSEEWNRRLARGEIDSYTIEKRYVHPDGQVHWAVLTAHLYRDPSGPWIQEIRTLVDITARKEAEAKLAETHRQLLDISRQAGMAEVATGVLHNVGNVLNSVNVSAAVLTDLARKSRVDRIAKVSDLLDENSADLPNFLSRDPRGQRLPAFLRALAEHLAKEQSEILAEIESLRRNIEHIKEVVSMQQSYARVSGVIESVSVVELVEDALRINADTLERHGIKVHRDFRCHPHLVTDKHRVIQILVNLVQNAKHACVESGRLDGEIAVRVVAVDGRVAISVADNGVGIPPENLTRIFAHGFTTRKNGHGFGLHSGANAAVELGGSLSAHSIGRGQGATFILELPETSVAPEHAARK